MNLQSLGQIIAGYAPLLGSVVAGKLGEGVGTIVASAFGGDINDPQKLIQTIVKDPDAAVKLAEIESTQKVELQRLAVLQAENELKFTNQALTIAHEDTKHARQNNQTISTVFPQFLSIGILAGFFICFYWIAIYPQDKSDHDILNILIGLIGSAFIGVINYWFGSSTDRKFK